MFEARRSESRPDRGIARTFIEVLNQKNEVVVRMKMVNSCGAGSTLANDNEILAKQISQRLGSTIKGYLADCVKRTILWEIPSFRKT